MTTRIAVAGKGGSGKSTFCALMTIELMKRGEIPILAVDADPNSNLGDLLGMKYAETISDVRDELRNESKIPAGTAKGDYINMRLNEIITESSGVDLMVLGRPEGRECYCYVNEILRGFLSKLSRNYKTIIMDNEAGMEHLSRRTTDNVDALFIIAEPNSVSMKAAERIFETTKTIKLKINRVYLVLNRTDKKPQENILYGGAEYSGSIPFDNNLVELSEAGKPLTNVPGDSPAYAAVAKIIDKVLGERR